MQKMTLHFLSSTLHSKIESAGFPKCKVNNSEFQYKTITQHFYLCDKTHLNSVNDNPVHVPIQISKLLKLIYT